MASGSHFVKNAGMTAERTAAHTTAGTFLSAPHARLAETASWLGIPYGVVPARFAAPRAVAPSQQGRQWRADRYGPAAWQPGDGPRPGETGFDEQCLSLNVFAPRGARELPTMVWVHGGGYLGGGSAQPDFDASRLARRQGIVVVSVNYRLGAFGSLARGTHRDDADADCTPDLGLLDIALALRWVQAHIGAFGGDPSAVTLAGQSAGGHAVAALATSPIAEGLFARAIISSAPPVALSATDGERVRAAVTAALGDGETVSSAAPPTLVAASVAAYLSIAEETPGVLGSAPIVDGVVLPDEPLSSLASGRGHAVPLLIGTNRDEATSFSSDPLIRTDEATLARLGRPEVPAALASDGHERDEATERWFRLPALAAAAGHAAVTPTWAYEFAYVPSGFAAASDGGPGATHGIEAAFLFGNTETGLWRALAPHGPTPSDIDTVDRFQSAWGAFVRGAPLGWAALPSGGVHVFPQTTLSD